MLKMFIEEYMSGNKKRIGDILSLKKDKIIELLQKGLKKKTVKKVLEEELKINIKDDTFYKWFKRNIKNIPLTNPATQKLQKSNSERNKNTKVTQKEEILALIDELTPKEEEEDFDRNAGKTGFLDDI